MSDPRAAFNWRTFVQPFVAVPKISEIRHVETAEWVMVPGDSVVPKLPKGKKTPEQLMHRRERKRATYHKNRAARMGD